MASLAERVRALEVQVAALAPRVAELEREVDGNGRGDRKSLRTRLHDLENREAGSSLVAEALGRADQAARSAKERKWSRRDKIAGAVLLIVTAPAAVVLPWLNLYLILRAR